MLRYTGKSNLLVRILGQKCQFWDKPEIDFSFESLKPKISADTAVDMAAVKAKEK